MAEMLMQGKDGRYSFPAILAADRAIHVFMLGKGYWGHTGNYERSSSQAEIE